MSKKIVKMSYFKFSHMFWLIFSLSFIIYGIRQNGETIHGKLALALHSMNFIAWSYLTFERYRFVKHYNKDNETLSTAEKICEFPTFRQEGNSYIFTCLLPSNKLRAKLAAIKERCSKK
jgi:hypothetical protein